MQVLLVFNREDPFIITLKNAILKCGSSVKSCRNIQETHQAFKKINFDLVFIDSRRSSSSQFQLSANTTTSSGKPSLATSSSNSSAPNQYDYENICCEERETPSVLPYLKIGFNKTFSETTSLIRCTNELLTLEYGEVSTVRRLQAAHALFTALEYTSDPVEILNDDFKLLYANNAFERLSGLTLNEVSGKDFYSIHRIDPNEQLHKQTPTPGSAWEFSLPFQKSNGELVNYTSLTIPVIVQGETNKVQNYVTITNVSDNKLTSIRQPIRTNSTRKVTSFVMPKRSYDFEKFATDSITSEANNNSDDSSATKKLALAKPAPSDQLNFKIDSTPIEDSNNEILNANLTNNSINQTRVQDSIRTTVNYEFSNSNLSQRKRSYDVHPIGHGSESAVNMPRRHSMAKVHQQNIEAPIRKVINIICLAQENSSNDVVKQNLEKALEILRSTELYNPALIENDKHTSDLVSGLMSNGLQKRIGNFLGPRAILNYQSSSTTQNFVKNLSPEIMSLLDQEESWSFDIIALERLSNFRPLLLLGLKIMNRFGVCDYLKIDESLLVNWLTLIESNYRPGNPYHNSTHASDVLHASAYFLSTDKLCEILDESDRAAALIAAAVHDLNHPGRTNAFLCNSNSDLAILYNDQAVLENHHVSLAFQLTRQNQDANIFKNLSRDEYRALRSIIIDMVLATEMNKHFEHLNKFVNKFGISDDEKAAPVKSIEMLKVPENKVLIKRMLIKCADVNNPCRPLDIYKEWTNRIANEYFEQTDEEKQKGLPVVMATYDRSSCNIPKAQISFIEYFINDMFEAWDEFIYLPELTNNLQANTVYWRECAEELEQGKQKPEYPLQQQQQLHKTPTQAAVGSVNENKDRNDSIYEDNESEIDK